MALLRSSWQILALGLVLAVTSLTLAATPATPPQQAPTVQISLDDDSVQVFPSRVEVVQGQVVTWSSSVPFAIVLNDQDTVFPGLPPQAMRGLSRRPVQARVGGNTPARSYKYTVVVWDGQQLRVLDPEIVVKPTR